MIITLDTDLQDFVTTAAQKDGVTEEVYCERKLNGAIRRVMKDQIIDQINSAPVAEVKRYITAVDVVKAEILDEKRTTERVEGNSKPSIDKDTSEFIESKVVVTK